MDDSHQYCKSGAYSFISICRIQSDNKVYRAYGHLHALRKWVLHFIRLSTIEWSCSRVCSVLCPAIERLRSRYGRWYTNQHFYDRKLDSFCHLHCACPLYGQFNGINCNCAQINILLERTDANYQCCEKPVYNKYSLGLNCCSSSFNWRFQL